MWTLLIGGVSLDVQYTAIYRSVWALHPSIAFAIGSNDPNTLCPRTHGARHPHASALFTLPHVGLARGDRAHRGRAAPARAAATGEPP
eukprot:2602804-Prymnesium_polylepis.1